LSTDIKAVFVVNVNILSITTLFYEALTGLKAGVSGEILHSPNPNAPRLRRVLLPFIQAVNYLVFWRRRIKIVRFLVIAVH
jgi:hypothetical protein